MHRFINFSTSINLVIYYCISGIKLYNWNLGFTVFILIAATSTGYGYDACFGYLYIKYQTAPRNFLPKVKEIPEDILKCGAPWLNGTPRGVSHCGSRGTFFFGVSRGAKPLTALNPSWFGAGAWVKLFFPFKVKSYNLCLNLSLKSFNFEFCIVILIFNF